MGRKSSASTSCLNFLPRHFRSVVTPWCSNTVFVPCGAQGPAWMHGGKSNIYLECQAGTLRTTFGNHGQHEVLKPMVLGIPHPWENTIYLYIYIDSCQNSPWPIYKTLRFKQLVKSPSAVDLEQRCSWTQVVTRLAHAGAATASRSLAHLRRRPGRSRGKRGHPLGVWKLLAVYPQRWGIQHHK